MAIQQRDDVELLMRSAEALLLAASDEGQLLASATELLGAQYGYGARYVVLHDPLARELYLGGAAGQIAETSAIKDYRRPDGAGLSGWCWTSGEVVNVADVRDDPRYMEVLPSCRSEICVPIVAGAAVLGVLGVQSDRLAAFSEHDERLLSAYARLLAMGLVHARELQARQRDIAELRVLNERIRVLSVTDDLTGAYNTRHAMERLGDALRAANRREDCVSLLVIDGDRMKAINDAFGHAEGNGFLVALTETMRPSLRATDVLARFGGDEFVIVLPGTCADDAVAVADRLRHAVAQQEYRTSSGEPVRTTISVGVASSPEDGLTADALFRAADAALYAAKQSGRNRVMQANCPS
ncbi:MAG TPA: diguanylate cyclase [Candidatus Acidoferrales bacterium]|nr:diguanylate cyclase [Candidatus Acidoferrales bacterium]